MIRRNQCKPSTFFLRLLKKKKKKFIIIHIDIFGFIPNIELVSDSRKTKELNEKIAIYDLIEKFFEV